jgi:hypothetical protein
VPKEISDMPDGQPKFDLLNKFLDEHLITTTANEGDLYGFHKFIVHRTTYKVKRDYGRILDVALGIEEGDENDELEESWYDEDSSRGTDTVNILTNSTISKVYLKFLYKGLKELETRDTYNHWQYIDELSGIGIYSYEDFYTI